MKTKEQEVKELVERVRLTDEEIKALLPSRDGYSYYYSFGEAVREAQLNKVLNDPDLALIEWEYHPIYYDKWCYPIIPLAEALKEKQ